MDRASTIGKMARTTKANGKTTKSMAKEYTPGKMAGSMQEIGKKTIWTVMEFTHGKTAENTKVNIRMIRSKAMALTPGLMAASIKENGMMVNSIIVVSISIRMDSRVKASGKMERESNGSMKINEE